MVNDEYTGYSYKRLANVIKTIVTSSKIDCMTLCSMTDDCLAVNVFGNHDITCQMTRGLSNENEMEDDHNSQLYVLSKLIYKQECQFNESSKSQIFTHCRRPMQTH